MTPSPQLEIFTDGGSRGNPGPGASAFIVYKDNKEIFRQSYFFEKTTNNIAEYFAVLMAITWLLKNEDQLGAEGVEVNIDSELIVKQLNGIYKIKNENLKRMYLKIVNTTRSIKIKIAYNHIPRERNKVADAEVNDKMDENL